MISSANAGKDSIVVVDWAPGEMNDDPAQWVALEAAYTITRTRLIAEAVSDASAIDADAIRKQANQVEKDLGAFKDLKTKTTHAKTSVEAIEKAVEALETELKTSIEVLNDLAKA
jgi:predicted RNase H-like HicB family nuclease